MLGSLGSRSTVFFKLCTELSCYLFSFLHIFLSLLSPPPPFSTVNWRRTSTESEREKATLRPETNKPLCLFSFFRTRTTLFIWNRSLFLALFSFGWLAFKLRTERGIEQGKRLPTGNLQAHWLLWLYDCCHSGWKCTESTSYWKEGENHIKQRQLCFCKP